MALFKYNAITGKLDLVNLTDTDTSDLTDGGVTTLHTHAHGTLTELTDDDHAQYALLAGRTGGQTLKGSIDSGGNLTLQSSANATKGNILFGLSKYDEVNNRLSVGNSSSFVNSARSLNILGSTAVMRIVRSGTTAAAPAVELIHTINDSDVVDGAGAVFLSKWDFFTNVDANSNPTNTWFFIRNRGLNGVSANKQVFQIGYLGDTLITGMASTVVPLTLKAAASQSSNIQEWQKSDGTVYAEISGTGDLVFTQASTGLPYGHMYAKNATIVVTIAAANTPYEITTGITGGNANLTTFGGSHYLQVSRAGTYLVNYSVSMDTSSPQDEVESGTMINGTESTTDGGAHTTVVQSGRSGNTAGSAILTLAANDQVSLYVRNHSGANNVTVEHLNMTVTMVGG